MKKRMIIMIIALFIVFGGIFGWDALRSYFMHQFFANFQLPPVTISSTKAKAQTWQPFLSTIGTLEAVNGVDISPEVSGTIEAIYFTSGEIIQKGDPIIKIDDRIELADLENNQAELKLAKLDYQRTKNLYEKKAVSKAKLDQSQAQLTQAQAAVDKSNALVQEKNITAPFTGKLGIRQVNLGQYLSPGATIVTLQALTPIFINFSLPEQDLRSLHVEQTIEIKVDTYPDKIFHGKITAINAKVDIHTHNILVQATLPNKNQLLYPGQFVNVKVLLPIKKNVITVPQTAVAYNLFGNSVFVIHQYGKDKNGKPILKVTRVYVTTGMQKSGQVAILTGIKAGDEVVTSGQLKLENNTRVVINNSVKLQHNNIENN